VIGQSERGRGRHLVPLCATWAAAAPGFGCVGECSSCLSWTRGEKAIDWEEGASKAFLGVRWREALVSECEAACSSSRENLYWSRRASWWLPATARVLAAVKRRCAACPVVSLAFAAECSGYSVGAITLFALFFLYFLCRLISKLNKP
jgi:hypothetical protein